METVQASISYQSLLEKFELTKKELGDAEETIKRITGRDPDFLANCPSGLPWKTQVGSNIGRPFPPGLGSFPSGRKRPLFPIVKIKEEEDVTQEEESPDEGEIIAKKPALQSTVVATLKDVKSRKDTIQEQNINSKVKARNRRMLGMILGTLQKFQHEAKNRKEQDLKRAEIEQKVEAAAAEEKERLKKEKDELFLTRKEKQIQLRCLEKKIEIAELHEAWENNQKPMVNFIRTTAQPSLYFLPAKHTSESEKRLQESKTKTLELLQQCKQKVEKELSEVEEWYKKDNFPSDKENIGPHNEEQASPDEDIPLEEISPAILREVSSPAVEEEERTQDKNLTTLTTDQEFEPIYD